MGRIGGIGKTGRAGRLVGLAIWRLQACFSGFARSIFCHPVMGMDLRGFVSHSNVLRYVNPRGWVCFGIVLHDFGIVLLSFW